MSKGNRSDEGKYVGISVNDAVWILIEPFQTFILEYLIEEVDWLDFFSLPLSRYIRGIT